MRGSSPGIGKMPATKYRLYKEKTAYLVFWIWQKKLFEKMPQIALTSEKIHDILELQRGLRPSRSFFHTKVHENENLEEIQKKMKKVVDKQKHL